MSSTSLPTTLPSLSSIKLEDKKPDQNPIDYVYEQIGNGSYQLKLTVLFCITSIFNSAYFLMPGLLFQQPIFLCKGQECLQSEFCKLPENQRSLSSDSFQSITIEQQLYCEKEYLNSIGSSLVFLGAVVGLYFSMYWSDNKGRKISYGLTSLISLFGTLMVVIFSFNLYAIFAGYFISGFAAAIIILQSVFLGEISFGNFRSSSLCLLYVAWAVGECLLWPMTLLFQDWKNVMIFFIVIPYCLQCVFYFFIMESPRFLQNKDSKQCVEVLKKMAVQNSKELEIEENDVNDNDNQQQQEQKYNYLDLFRYRSLRKTTIPLCLICIGIFALYFGMQFSLDLISSNYAKTSCFIGIADLFSYYLCNFLCPRLSRKKSTIITLLLTSVICICFVFAQVPENCQSDSESCIQKTVSIVMAITARFIVSIAFSFIACWRNELYPKTIRAQGVGNATAMGFMGAYLIPYAKQVCGSMGVNFLIVFGVFGLVCCLLCLKLKETLGKEMEEEIEEKKQQVNKNTQDFKSIRKNLKKKVSQVVPVLQTQVSITIPTETELVGSNTNLNSDTASCSSGEKKETKITMSIIPEIN